MKKAAIIVGTRPEAIKLVPVYLYLHKNSTVLGLRPILISTGQHKEMLLQIFEFFDIKPDFDLDVMTENQSLVQLAENLIRELGQLFERIKPDLVMVQGDTTSAMVGGLIGYYSKIKVAHIEAGLRTYNRFSPYPEEANRQMIGSLADFHFAPTQQAHDNLILEKKQGVIQVGNTVIDSLQLCIDKVNAHQEIYQEKFKSILDRKKIVLITGHRRENFGSGFESICDALVTLAERHDEIRFVYPVHLNPNVKNIVNERLGNVGNISLLPPVPYDDLVFLMSRSFMILTDSGGIQEEAPTLNIPLLVMRDTTERPEGIDAGCAILVGTDKDNIVNTFEEIHNDPERYKQMSMVENPYGDGHSSERIAKHLSEHL